MDKDKIVQVEDPPDPDLPDLQQRDLPMPTVPVAVDGKVRVQHIPNRTSSVDNFPLDTVMRRVLPADPKRARATLVSTSAWLYGKTRGGQGAPIPANVMITVTHSDEVCAAVPTSTGNLAVIGEYWAD